ncbi:hypothetical protein SAMN06298226_1368 [Nitrosovibrio sp. Nv4]|nr:hypothetical protein SAMN06298226_1368 [Nitrosovibrio sp. Nv4]
MDSSLLRHRSVQTVVSIQSQQKEESIIALPLKIASMELAVQSPGSAER